MGEGIAFDRVRLAAPAGLERELADFYSGLLELPLASGSSGVSVHVGETVLELQEGEGAPFYHFALLVPGDRFEAALEWASERVVLLPDRESGEIVFDFAFWEAAAVYFHDPAGSIVELIAHRGAGERGSDGPFRGSELLGVSEVGVVCDPPAVAEALGRELGLEVWDGAVDGESRLAFVGEKARTLILCRTGRPWLPTGQPAEAHPLEVSIAGAPKGEVVVAGGTVVRGTGTT